MTTTTRLSAQQKAVLQALIQQSPLPTTILRDVRAREGEVRPGSPFDGTYRIGPPVGAVLRRLEQRGFVTGEGGPSCKDWSITDAGLEAMGWTR